MEGSVNSDVDLQSGDLLLAIDGEPAQFSDQSTPLLLARKGQTAVLIVLRNGIFLERKVKVNAAGMIDFKVKVSAEDLEAAGFRKIIRKEYSFGQSVGIGLHQFNETVIGYWSQLKLIFSPSTGAYKGVGGFKAIMDIFPDTWSWYAFWNITAFLSIMLGVLNLLPIPALDGGHVVFLLYEMVTGRKPGDKFMEYAQTVGFLILIALVLFANGNDIYKAIFS